MHTIKDGRKGGNDDDDGSTLDDSVSQESITRGRLVDVAYFETLMIDKDPWGDHYFLSGFQDIFTTGEVWIEEISCIPCGNDYH